MWNFHVDDSAKGRYDMILDTDILTDLGLNLKLYDNVIESDDGHFKVSTALMVNIGSYEFEDFNTGNITPEELFMDAYAEKIYDQVRTSTKQLRVILDAKYKGHI